MKQNIVTTSNILSKGREQEYASLCQNSLTNRGASGAVNEKESYVSQFTVLSEKKRIRYNRQTAN